jgi:hypothetical protein
MSNVKVRFTDPDEFIEEYRARGCAQLVRLTKRYSTMKQMPTIRHVSVVAGFTRLTYDQCVEIVELERYVGDYWGADFDRKALTAADELADKIEKGVKEAGGRIAAGCFVLEVDAQ